MVFIVFVGKCICRHKQDSCVSYNIIHFETIPMTKFTMIKTLNKVLILKPTEFDGAF